MLEKSPGSKSRDNKRLHNTDSENEAINKLFQGRCVYLKMAETRMVVTIQLTYGNEIKVKR